MNFGDIPGEFLGKNRDVFVRRIPLAWEVFRGMEGENKTLFYEEIAPEREKARGECGRNGKKRTRSDLLRALFRVIIRETLCAS